MHYSCHFGCEKAVAMLLNDQTVHVNALDTVRNTPLHVALAVKSEADMLEEKRGVRGKGDLFLDRAECAKRVNCEKCEKVDVCRFWIFKMNGENLIYKRKI